MFLSLLRRLLWLVDHPLIGVYGVPLATAAGFYFAFEGPEWWKEFFLEHAMGFLISLWIGSGFAHMWWVIGQEARQMPGGETAAVGAALVGLLLVGGLTIFTDAWLFGVAVWPGLSMLLPKLYRLLTGMEPHSVEEAEARQPPRAGGT